jgi:hypothetical protein
MKEKYIAGVFATITWESPYSEERVYISFAPDPVDKAHDAYGVADRNIFYYAHADELAELMEPYNGNGWRITEIHMTNMVKHVTPDGWYQSEVVTGWL